MPILEVEIVLDPGESLKAGLAQDLADLAGRLFCTPRGRTWVRLRSLPGTCYAENGGALLEDVRPIFVTVLKSNLPGPDELNDEVAQLCVGIADLCGRAKGNVHILYLPEAAGRMWFGGQLVPPSQSPQPAQAADPADELQR